MVVIAHNSEFCGVHLSDVRATLGFVFSTSIHKQQMRANTCQHPDGLDAVCEVDGTDIVLQAAPTANAAFARDGALAALDNVGPVVMDELFGVSVTTATSEVLPRRLSGWLVVSISCEEVPAIGNNESAYIEPASATPRCGYRLGDDACYPEYGNRGPQRNECVALNA